MSDDNPDRLDAGRFETLQRQLAECLSEIEALKLDEGRAVSERDAALAKLEGAESLARTALRVIRQYLRAFASRTGSDVAQHESGSVESASQQEASQKTAHEPVQAARHALLLCMREYSEAYWAAAWLHGLEFELWEEIKRFRGDTEPTGRPARTSSAEIEVISWLAGEAGGWWIWDKSAGGNKFVTLAEWVEMYRNREAGQ